MVIKRVIVFWLYGCKSASARYYSVYKQYRSSNSGTVPTINNRFADMHSHTSLQPPSPGDLYGFINTASSRPGYLRFVMAPNGAMYALAVIDQEKANIFKGTSVNLGYGPDFPEDIHYAFENVELYGLSQGFNNLISKERAMAFVMDKYDSGVILLKQDANGNFKRLRTDENTQNGVATYTANNCQ